MGFAMMVDELSLVEVCSKCCELETAARWFSEEVEVEVEGEKDTSSLYSAARGFLMTVGEEVDSAEVLEWSKCSQCTRCQ